MWRLIYRFFSYPFFLFSLFFLVLKKKTRITLKKRLRLKVRTNGKRIWIHSASLGEALIAKTLIDFLSKKAYHRFLVTTHTSYSKELLEREIKKKAEILYAPFDLCLFVRSFIKNQNVKSLILVETELWPNMIWEAKRAGIPVIIVNGRISERTYPLYRRLKFFMRSFMSKIDLVLAQSEKDAERFLELGVDPKRVSVMGNLKYLRDFQNEVSSVKKLKAVTFGSIRDKEKDGILRVIKDLKRKYPDLIVYIAPRTFDILGSLERELISDLKVERYSKIKTNTLSEGDFDVILVDTVGDLPKIYAKSLVAFVGGSLFPYGGHNILEPLFFGTPVLFGPYVENFKEISEEIQKSHAGFMVKDFNELEDMLESLILNENLRESTKKNGLSLLARKREEIEKNLHILFQFIEEGAKSNAGIL